ncbi:aminoacyl-tRNA hydrolase [Pacificimonas flava]|uniref:Peptidyl-tRNA hydrolase n=1 Tax=Pacificimonas flava TaxID=1234595 RepID=M2TAP1_9SPHN|nr:aminoacyl-tRNA hydrolase [Pacificimonas flava]EMD83664.1 Peptidyl-tRNA hydrolase [Pacificimonas flava]MBB5280653.1 PTH1 family peptidyl-tRNA hydrolase [Pacificimonas flava]
MLIFAGLGNPGDKYRLHRHNIGFMAIDAVHEIHRFGPWTKKFQSELSAGDIAGERVILLKPQTFMNESGRAIGEAMRFYRLTPADVTVFYDELDLAPFKVKVKRGGGAAGHNGIRSTIAHIGEDFRRVRLGIGHPGHRDRVTPHVLGNFAKAEMDDLADLLGAVGAEVGQLAKDDDPRFLSDVAMRMHR